MVAVLGRGGHPGGGGGEEAGGDHGQAGERRHRTRADLGGGRGGERNRNTLLVLRL